MDFLNSKPIIELSGEEFLPKEGITNQKTNGLYVHDVTLTKNSKRMLRFPLQFLEIKISSPILKERLQMYYKIM